MKKNKKERVKEDRKERRERKRKSGIICIYKNKRIRNKEEIDQNNFNIHKNNHSNE